MTGKVEVLHIANAGFLVCGNGKKIIVDGIYGKTPRGFSAVPDTRQKKLLNGEPPFNGITHVLVSHFHKDHYDTETMLSFLEHQPKKPEIWFPGEERRIRRLRGIAPLHLVPLNLTDRFEYVLGEGDKLAYFVIRHSGREFREMKVVCYTLILAGHTLLFLSDADFDHVQIGGAQQGILHDIVFANPLFLDMPEGQRTLFASLKTDQVCICHIPQPEDDTYHIRNLADRCIEAYHLPQEKIRVLKSLDEKILLV